MAGNTGYTPVSNADPMQGPAQITDVYEHFDPLIGERRANAGALPTSGNWPGRTIFVEDIKCPHTWNGATWQRGMGAWLSWTPTLQNISLGAGGSSFGEYRYEGEQVRARIKLVVGGSGGGIGTGAGFTLPVTAAALLHPYMVYFSQAGLVDISAAGIYTGQLQAPDASDNTKVILRFTPSVGPSSPFAWANGDIIAAELAYRI